MYKLSFRLQLVCDSHHDAVVLRHFWTTVLHHFGIFMYSYIWDVPILHLTFMFYGTVYYSKKIGVHAIEWCKTKATTQKMCTLDSTRQEN